MTRDDYVFGPENCMCCTMVVLYVVLVHSVSFASTIKITCSVQKTEGGGLFGHSTTCLPRGWEESKRLIGGEWVSPQD